MSVTYTGDSETTVQVAVRIRPQNTRELIDMCRVCTSCTPNTPQIVLGKDKAFTYDFVFDTFTTQEYLYASCVEVLVKGCFDGYNATVLAYGQTGSGKTYTMGTGFDMTMLPEELGVIPRAVQEIFAGIEDRRASAKEQDEPLPQFEVKAQFLELYNEEIVDLFDEQSRGKLRIHEDSMGNIYVSGATEVNVSSQEETVACLKRGALSRTVGSTNMNAQSSRSHAIFTLHLVHQRPVKKQSDDEESDLTDMQPAQSSDWETLKAKFHFVDLAGSERLKRTGATGERAKEGISINCGLLSLGNVISALGDKMKKGSHVPYRDSKLTRLLQDSLGGNSKTLMIACVSPTDRDFMETLNTLKYSNRARNIKNKVVVNQDKMSQQLSIFRSRIQELELELQEFKSGRMIVSADGSVAVNDMANEITMLRTENDRLRVRVKAMHQVIESQANRLAEKEAAAFSHQDESTGQVLASGNESIPSNRSLSEVIKGYITQIEELKSRLILSESLARQNPQSPFRRAPSSIRTGGLSNTDELLKIAKDNIENLKMRGRRGSSLEGDEPHEKHSNRGKAQVTFQDLVQQTADTTSGGNITEGESSNEDSSDDLSDADTEETLTHPLSSDESDSDDDGTESLASSVAELSSEINLKQQLVDQLEKAQRSFYTMKSQYEDKMQLLQHQIKSVESERDRVLKDINTQRAQEKNDEKTKEIKLKYERQLAQLRAELRSMNSARKEHAKAMKKNVQHEKELKGLKSELLDMKKQRVKILNKMRSEATQKKLSDARLTKEIRQLQKESRKRDNKIKTLECDAKKRELVLKRRQDELSALRREKRNIPSVVPAMHQSSSSGGGLSVLTAPVSDGVTGYSATVTFRQHHSRNGGAFERNNRRRVSSVFSSDSARKKWREMEKKVFDAILKRQTMSNLAKDMDTWIEKRDKLSRKVDELKKQKHLMLNSESVQNEEVTSIVEEDLDSISANIDYVQENIVELQNDLIAVDDAKSEGDTLEAHTIIASSSPKEAKYLLEHLLDLVLNLGVKAAEKEAETKVLEVKLQASEQSAEIIKSLSSPQVSHPFPNQGTFKKSRSSLVSVHLHDSDPPKLNLDGSDLEVSSDSLPQSRSLNLDVERETLAKCRRRTILSSEVVASLPSAEHSSRSDSKTSVGSKEIQTHDTPSPAKEHVDGDGFKSECSRPRVESFEHKKKTLKKRAISSGSLDTSPSGPSSCPASPSLCQRQLKSSGSEVSVWSRLSSTSNAAFDTSKGSIQAEKVDARKIAGKVLHCTHTACGHAASVLSVFATQSYLFSGSQDRTVKIWNLKTCTELLTLDKHFSYVRCVRFCPRNNIIFTASQSLIKLWDMRHHRARCIKTFGPPAGSGSESAVHDLLVGPSGDVLYSASGNFINIWDLKKFMHRGRFVGHNGAVCALEMKGNVMATGSRDRLIKLYDLEAADSKDFVSQASICTLYPPHYDAVSSLAAHKDLLFSSCGVTIKQWDIKERSLKHAYALLPLGVNKPLPEAVDGAHSQGNTINSLATFSSPMMPLLVSGCKGGFLKLWNPETCSNIGDLLAHKHPINSVAANNTCIFTGSSDKTVRIWRPSPQEF